MLFISESRQVYLEEEVDVVYNHRATLMLSSCQANAGGSQGSIDGMMEEHLCHHKKEAVMGGVSHVQ